ncbi:4Fe-4S dicluster domain-containing protein [Butyrivibrio sp. XB500-5]|uniref:Coenzyme F420 hydrogenase/dehydrogenase, beta subunit C-terminal domain n=1 Tax=Butyrivibrio sp. XB500-5 TaxID=2364880 RepID=UPI000EA99C4C|nr:Coenzyme F420 hydrogenase/dehydrogenase, beta subunit C-terminal domain [Butyrivibrio sp. XB500-5]RKM59558.1 4Fe-4S dicluster domain-containing protein [Butyrivibrio sp. XB500-5]
MINFDNKENCCGCGICTTVCPTKSINLVTDEMGFERAKVNVDTCINCSLCNEVCPLQGETIINKPLTGYIVQCKDEMIRIDSTSGGAFTPLAKKIIDDDGVVYGVIMHDGHAQHVRSTDVKDISLMRNSKYTQSSMRRMLEDQSIEQDISSGRKVLFSGTPCQVNGIKNKYGKHDNLITVEVMCREVVSPLLLSKYIDYMEKKNHDIINKIRFRDKHYGYHYSTMNVSFSSGKQYYKPLNYDPYLKAFFSNAFARESCFSCPFRGVNRGADITIWDAWDVSRYEHLNNDDKGSTKMLVNTEKGKVLFESCKNDFYLENCTVEELIGDVSEMEQPLAYSDNFPQMREDLVDMTSQSFFNKYWRITPSILLRNMIKTILYKNRFTRKMFF